MVSEKVLIEILLIIVVVFVFVYRFNKNKRKGTKGELRVARRLRKLKGKEYEVLNDVLIRTSSGSSQIDHIVISIFGIFVIETKNFSGWIHGHENSEYWTQTIYKKKTKFRNPIKQNWAHIYALKNVLSKFKQVTYYPIVVFSGNAELKKISSTTPVIYDQQLVRTINGITRKPILSVEQVKNIAGNLNEINLQDRRAKREHVRQVKKNARERKQKEKMKICPWCGGELIVRNGQYGKFYGCSNFPKCTYKLSYRTR